MELRVLSGPQAGCRLPLGTGLYRAGADDSCDVVLEGLPADQIAFVIYVGHRTLALESLIDGLRVEGRPARGLCELAAGNTFELQSWVFAVDEAEAPWPEEGATTRLHEDEDDTDASMGSEGNEAGVPPEPGSAEVAAAAGGQPDAATASESAGVPSVTAVRAARRARLPFWAAGLLGSAAFIGLGVVALAVTLAPNHVEPVRDTGNLEQTLRRIAASAGAETTLEHLPTGRWSLSGHVATRLQKAGLMRQARDADPSVRIHISADEDLEGLVHNALTLFPNSGAQFGSLHLGRLTLTGHVSDGQQRERIVAAMWTEVPGLVSLDNQISAADDSLTALRDLLASAGIAERISGALDSSDGTKLIVSGSPDEAERQKWLEARASLAERFGASLQIVERFSATVNLVPARIDAEPRSDVVAVVMGPMPYVLLRDGTRQAASARKGDR